MTSDTNPCKSKWSTTPAGLHGSVCTSTVNHCCNPYLLIFIVSQRKKLKSLRISKGIFDTFLVSNKNDSSVIHVTYSWFASFVFLISFWHIPLNQWQSTITIMNNIISILLLFSVSNIQAGIFTRNKCVDVPSNLCAVVYDDEKCNGWKLDINEGEVSWSKSRLNQKHWKAIKT